MTDSEKIQHLETKNIQLMARNNSLEAVLAAWRAHAGGDDPVDDRTVVVVKVLRPIGPAGDTGAV